MENNKLKASFRGVPFFISSEGLETGRRLVRHEYPNKDTSYAEDMGKKTREYPVEAYVIGSDYKVKRDNLIAACEKNGAGELIHPSYGTVKVKCDACSVHENKEEGRIAYFSLSFVEAGENIQPTVTADTRSSVKSKAKSVRQAVKDDFIASIKVDGQPGFVIDGLVSKLEKDLGVIKNAAGADASLFYKNINELDGGLSEYVVGSSSELAERIESIVLDATDFNHIFNNVDEVVVSYEQTPSRIAEAESEKASTAYVKQLALVSIVEQNLDAEFDSYQDAIAYRDDVTSKLDAEMEREGISDELYLELSSLRAAVVQDIEAKGADLRHIVKEFNKVTRPALVVAYEHYGDAAKEDEVVARNKVQHPGFISGGQELEFLSNV